MNKHDVAFELALKCVGLARHLAHCPKCRRNIKRRKPKRMCPYGHEDVDRILYYLSKYDDDWALLSNVVDRLR